MQQLPILTTMTLEEILNTDVYTALPEGIMVEEELNCQDEERLPNISTLLRASEVDLGIINDQASIPPTTSAIPAIIPLTIPATATSFTRSEEETIYLFLNIYGNFNTTFLNKILANP